MIKLVLPILKNNYGIKELLYTCDEDNIGSIRAIMKNGGEYKDKIIEKNGNIINRYIVKL